MKIILSLILILNSILAFSQSKMNLDKAFLGIPSDTAISGRDLDGRKAYKIYVDEWLEILSKSELEGRETIVTPDDFIEPKKKYLKILKKLNSESEKLELSLRQIILGKEVFPSRIIEFDENGNFVSTTLVNPNYIGNVEALAVLKGVLDEIYGESEKNDDQDTTIYYWLGYKYKLQFALRDNAVYLTYKKRTL